MKKFDAEKIFFYKIGSFVNLEIFQLILNELIHEKTCFCIFYGLCVLISFSLLTITVRGVSNKHCLLPFSF